MTRRAPSTLPTQNRPDKLFGSNKRFGEPLSKSLFKISVHIENRTPETGGVANRRDAVLFQSFVSTHTILQVRQGSFISLMDPPEALQHFVKGLQNTHTWPVLVGKEGERDAIVSSP